MTKVTLSVINHDDSVPQMQYDETGSLQPSSPKLITQAKHKENIKQIQRKDGLKIPAHSPQNSQGY